MQEVATKEFQKTVTAYTSYAITTNRPVVAWVAYNSWDKRYELYQVLCVFFIRKTMFFFIFKNILEHCCQNGMRKIGQFHCYKGTF